jgi:putative nucleotidyltransferase with HDIG domain
MDRGEIYIIFPEHHWIQDEDLKTKCADTWLEAIELGGWDEKGLENCPVVLKGLEKAPDNNITHVRGVTQLSVKMFDQLKESYPDAGDCDRDVVIAGALLHDVGKLLEYDFIDKKAVLSANGAMFGHPCSGAWLAQKHGLPEKVVHVILAHSDLMSPGGANAFQTRESLIVKYADCMCFFYLLKHYG